MVSLMHMHPVRLFFHWLLSTVAVLVAAYVVPGVTVTLPGAIIAAVVLAALNLIIRPILLFITLPITILTLGLFSLVVNAFLVLVASSLVPGFSIDGFWPAFFFAIVLAVVNWVFHIWA